MLFNPLPPTYYHSLQVFSQSTELRASWIQSPPSLGWEEAQQVKKITEAVNTARGQVQEEGKSEILLYVWPVLSQVLYFTEATVKWWDNRLLQYQEWWVKMEIKMCELV